MDCSAGIVSFRSALEKLPDVLSVEGIEADGNVVCCASVTTRTVGRLAVKRLDAEDAPALFDFYCQGLSERTKRLFAPFPLFDRAPESMEELARRIADWKKEQDWTGISLVRKGSIVAFAVLKRFWTEQVTSGIAVRDDFHRKGLGVLLQQIIVEQARLLGIGRFHIKVISDNASSVRLHEKCGFRQTRVLPPMYEETLEYLNECDRKDGVEPHERQIVEMVIDL